MFSRLDSFFVSTMRHAESADARMEIKRDEERNQGRRQNNEKEAEDTPRWEDTTVVSVPALMAFLESLIAESPQNLQPSVVEKSPNVPQQPQAAAAAKAYQTTAGTRTQPQPSLSSGSKPLLTPEETSTIKQLLADLEFLANRKVESLTILRSDSFLQSLVDAAARARQGL